MTIEWTSDVNELRTEKRADDNTTVANDKYDSNLGDNKDRV